MDPPPSRQKPNKSDAQHKPQAPSTSELLSSAKVVADAAKASLRHETNKVDKGRVASATADLLGAASHYGKLESENGLGKYVDKAENYLHQYHSSHPTTPSSSSTTTTNSGHNSQGGGGGSSGGYGDYLKMAEGFLKKR